MTCVFLHYNAVHGINYEVQCDFKVRKSCQSRRHGLMSSLTDIFFGIIWCREKKEEEVEPICQ